MVTKATHVDHVKAHRGDEVRFRDPNNLQSLCNICHNSAKQREEVTGDAIGCDVDGWPRGAQAFWNTGTPIDKRDVPKPPPKPKRYTRG